MESLVGFTIDIVYTHVTTISRVLQGQSRTLENS